MHFGRLWNNWYKMKHLQITHFGRLWNNWYKMKHLQITHFGRLWNNWYKMKQVKHKGCFSKCCIYTRIWNTTHFFQKKVFQNVVIIYNNFKNLPTNNNIISTVQGLFAQYNLNSTRSIAQYNLNSTRSIAQQYKVYLQSVFHFSNLATQEDTIR